MVNVIPRENILPFMKYKGFSYPTHLLKIGVSGIKNYLIEYRTKQVKIFAQRNVFQTLLDANNENVYSIGTFRDPVATQFIVKV